MINKILDAISNALNEEFGDDIEIYSEDIKQGFKEPCFFIICLNPTEKDFLGSRYLRKYLFDIQYFPKNKKNLNFELYSVQERLFNCLEYLETEGDLIRGTGRRGEIVDKKLHFFVNYNIFVVKKGPQDEFMENIKVDMKTRSSVLWQKK